ncbi:MAG: hypothetical protein Q7S21_02675 [archaeon]|nr:hypothetical protein [archaeon]
MVPKRKGSMAQRVAGLRRRITSDFYLRGATRDESFSTRKELELGEKRSGYVVSTEEIPVYFINPRFNLDSREWTKKLHSTLHAAVGRAVMKMGIYWPEWKKFSASHLPILMAFGPLLLSHGRMPGKIAVANSKALYKTIAKSSGKTKSFRDEFSQRRQDYEKATIHGRVEPTFTESALSIGFRDGKGRFDNTKLFEVRMTKPEFVKIVTAIDAKLQRFGISSIGEFYEKYVIAVEEQNVAEKNRLWNIVLQISGHQGIHIEQFQETASRSPASYLFYLEASKLLTNKFVRTGMKWVEKNIPRK